MRIIHFLPGKANPDRMNGVNKVVHQLAVMMQEKGMAVTVAGITDTTQIDEARPYPLVLLKGRLRSFSLPQGIKQFLDSLPQDTIVHFHGVLLPLYAVIARYLRTRHIAYVVTPHGALLPRSLRQRYVLKKLYITFIEKHFLNGASRIQAITEQEKQALSQWPVTIIPNGHPYTLTEAERYKSGTEIIFGYIGRLAARHKGLDALIDGFSLYCQDHETGKLWLIGDGADKAALVARVRKAGLEKRVVFWGEKHGVEKIELLQQMDVFVHPSRWDVLPTAILEAAAHKIPLLVTQATGFAEAITTYDSGIVISETMPCQINNAMEVFYTAYRDKTLESCGRRAEQMVKERYDWHHIIGRMTSELYGMAA